MNTAGAIRKLRDHMGIKQREFAEKLGLDPTTVSRYENGREPPPPVLERLAKLADLNGLDYLRDLFSAKQRGDEISRIEKLPSSGSARRIPVKELSTWAKWQNEIYWGIELILRSRMEWKHASKLLREYMGLAQWSWDGMYPYIDPKANRMVEFMKGKIRTPSPAPEVLGEKRISTPEEINKTNREYYDSPEPEEDSTRERKRRTRSAKKAR